MRRRAVLAGAAALPWLQGCERAQEAPVSRWVGASFERGHRLRTLKSGSLPVAAVQRRAGVLVIGGGVAGLSALHALDHAGHADAQLLELEDQAGGNSRGHIVAGLACPLGAHYLPVPGESTYEVSAWLHDIGLLRSDSAGVHANERYLCHSPQERLFIDGAWQDGLLPSAQGRPATLAQYRRFAALVDHAQRELGFALPTHRVRWSPGHAALDEQRFDAWLAANGLDDTRLLGYLDYCCRDDYGAGIHTVSAWAGLHYFASRHGFHAPGDDSAERDAVFTWPEGNAWLVRELAEPLKPRLCTGRTVLRVELQKHGVQVLAWDETAGQAEAWTADAVVLALPLFIASRIVAGLDAPLVSALQQAAAGTRYAPWLVANLLLKAPLLNRLGAPSSWDNVAFAPAGSSLSLGYVDAQHQSLRPDTGLAGPQLLTAYCALPETRRPEMLAGSAEHWTAEIVRQLAPPHPDLASKLQQADLMRWGHAMSIPVPGTRSQPAREALRQAAGRLRFAHADLAGYSVFEEAFTLGWQAGRGLVTAARLASPR
ncbi:FAD-dependent oxidoreductase [Ideonella azotifigens]|uniref:FAD-dependent oxidoreductase n=1 Tax=Ideonella azotifigens TaxID=513160 RepID=A0ABP3UTE9_9BURK|nr:FAD-dependent oxidoreductase [Ideonella azotifigens]